MNTPPIVPVPDPNGEEQPGLMDALLASIDNPNTVDPLFMVSTGEMDTLDVTKVPTQPLPPTK